MMLLKNNGLALLALTVVALSSQALANVDVPGDAQYKGSAFASGYQIYQCGDNYQWGFRSPTAELSFDDGAGGIHYGGIDYGYTPGPYWERDGSWVRGRAIASQDNPGSIPLLLLEPAEQADYGYFGDVAYIQRLETSGGQGPTGDCGCPGEQFWSYYTAQYHFWTRW